MCVCVCVHVCVYTCRCEDAVIQVCVCVCGLNGTEWLSRSLNVGFCLFTVVVSQKTTRMSVPSVIETPMKFLGLPTTANLDTLDHRSASLSLSSYLLRVDSHLIVSRRQKLKLYNLAIYFRISWNLSIHALPLSWIESTLKSEQALPNQPILLDFL